MHLRNLIGLGLLAVSLQGAFGILTPAATYYVNQSTGSDSNNGASTATPFLTVAKCVSVLSGAQGCAVFGGTASQLSYLEQVTLAATGQYLVGYGAFKPNFDCADVIAAGGFTKTGGFSFIYQASVTTANETATGFLSIWENGAYLTLAASQAALDSAPGYWIDNNGSLSGTSHTVFIHATGDGNPASNGLVYENNNRAYGVNSNYRATVANVQTSRNYNNNGSLEVGAGSLITSIRAYRGTKHNMLVHTGTTVQSSTVDDAYYAGQGTIMLVYNDNTPHQEGLTFRYLTLSMPVYTIGTNGIGGHVNSGGSFGALSYDHITLTNTQGGLDDIGADSVSVAACSITGVQESLNFYSPAVSVSSTTASATNHAVNMNAAQAITITSSALTGGIANQGAVRSSTGGVNLTITGSTITNTGSGSLGVELTGTGDTLTMSGNTFVFTVGTTNAYLLATGYLSWVSDTNAFPAGLGSNSMANISGGWKTLAQVRSQYGQEVHSTP